MLKKSLIPAALVALSSVSAFADSESSFYLGVKGLYFMPKDEISEDFQSQFGNNLKQSGGIFLPGLQFGYNVSDSIRVGLAGYFGASKFKYTGSLSSNTNVSKIITNDAAKVLGAVKTLVQQICDDASDSPGFIIRDSFKEFSKSIKDLDLGANLDSLVNFDNKIELGPRFVALATMDMKVYEADSFSLGFGLGAGAAKWKASLQAGKKDVSYSKWKPAFMGTVNANINLGDVAVLTGSVGYAHLGNPKGLKTSDDKGQTFDADANKAKGWVFGIGIGKEI